MAREGVAGCFVVALDLSGASLVFEAAVALAESTVACVLSFDCCTCGVVLISYLDVVSPVDKQ